MNKRSWNKFLVLILLFLSPFLLLTRLPTYASETSQRIVVKSEDRNFLNRLEFHRGISLSPVTTIDQLNIAVVEVPTEEERSFREELSQDPRVKYVEKDYVATADVLINDPGVVNNLQWGFPKVELYGGQRRAWDISEGNSNISVAIVDTGIDSTHEDLVGKVVGSKNCTDSSTVEDLYGHGTHVAGIVAASTNNGIGVAGVGYKTSLLNAKALGDSGSGYYSWIADCIVWAADNGANVINMSLGGGSSSQMLADSVNYARGKGVVLVAAAGNSGTNSPSYPAYLPGVISVAAVDQNDVKPSWSNFGNWVDVAAPGVSIYSTLPHYQNSMNKVSYGSLSGTSMASPHVAGLAALVYSISGLSAQDVENAIFANTDRIAGTNVSWVYGRINAYKTMASFSNNFVPSPTPTQTITPTPTSVPTPTPTLTPTKVPTSTPTPTIKTPTPTPTPSYSKNPWSRFCSRFSFLCR
ncbi:peptidase S8 [Candidatus Gottesmanbacteria bacterium]|nr:peptidase S8 [Candidatus Gottesmanbacteria bacterium]